MRAVRVRVRSPASRLLGFIVGSSLIADAHYVSPPSCVLVRLPGRGDRRMPASADVRDGGTDAFSSRRHADGPGDVARDDPDSGWRAAGGLGLDAAPGAGSD